MTSEETGGGGRADRPPGHGGRRLEDQLVHAAQATADRETLRRIAHTQHRIAALRQPSLVEFVEMGGPEADPAARIVSGTEVDDPWNFWVFSLNGTPRITGEKTRSVRRVNLNASASRVTPDWKSSINIWTS